MKVIQIEMPKMGGCIIKADNLDVATAELRVLVEEGAVGDKIIFELLEMSEDEYNKLPEWEGW